MSKAIVELKKQLRKDMANRLGLLSTSELKKQSRSVQQKLQEMDVFRASKNVSIYISMPNSEIVTTDIIHDLLNSDKNCFIPRCTKNTMDMVKINDIEDFESLPINKWNIPEPPLDQPRADAIDDNYGNGLDLILVPGVAFDKARNRIGHGKGYYDRYIKKCNIWADEHGIDRPKTIALSLKEQILEVGAIPLEETDERLDFILTPSDTF
ncbi:5-formyltetrahydrofolate cyclo-ligase-like protein [Parasitella parasitica]|nr:5-formyltetrahydrofolate cyclo-ligase-like protein [Parasitella parasitica]